MMISCGVIFILSSVFLTLINGNTEEAKVHDMLFNNQSYSVLTRPVINVHDPVEIGLAIALEEITGLSMKSKSMTTVVIFTMKWNDPRLKWNKATYNGTQVLNLPPSSIWTPDIVLINKAKEEKHNNHQSNINVNYNGDCVWVQPYKFTSTCNVDVTDFPFDKQTCNLRFGSWTMSKELLKFVHLRRITNDGVYFSDAYTSGGDWKVNKISETITTRGHSYSTTVFPEISYSFNLKHRPNYYILYMLLPCVIISILILLVFIIPPESGERIGLGITVLLNMSVYLLVVADHLPQTSEQSPLLGVFYVTVMYEIGWAFIVSIINLYIYYKRTEAPMWLRTLFRVSKQKKHAADNNVYAAIKDPLAKLSVHKRPHRQTNANTDESVNDKEVEVFSSEETLTSWKVIGRTLDFICFWFFMALFIVTTVSIIMLKPNIS